jgi:hypothetical protein
MSTPASPPTSPTPAAPAAGAASPAATGQPPWRRVLGVGGAGLVLGCLFLLLQFLHR